MSPPKAAKPCAIRESLLPMRQFYDTCRRDEKVSPLVRQILWSQNLLILSRCKHATETE